MPIVSEDTVAGAEMDDGRAKGLVAGRHSLREKIFIVGKLLGSVASRKRREAKSGGE